MAPMIHGYLGAGRTSFARRLERELSALRFTHDEWMVRLHGTSPPVEDFPDRFGRVTGLIGSVWPRCLELGLRVVFGLNFWSRRQHDGVRRTAVAVGGTSQVYRPRCPDDVAWQRIGRPNVTSDTSLIIARGTVKMLGARFGPLDGDGERAVAEVG